MENTDDLQQQLSRAVNRMLRWGLNPLIAQQMDDRCKQAPPSAFPELWRAEGDRWEQLADEAARTGHAVSATEWFSQSFFCNRLVDFYYTFDCEKKMDAYDAALRSFDGAVQWDGAPLRRVSVDFRGRQLPAQLLIPREAEHQRVPGVLAIYGADGNKEEHFWATMRPIAARGVAVLVADGPGQGWARRKENVGAVAEYEEFGKACVDVLATQPEVDPSRLAVSGSSMGGYYAPRLFACDERLRACSINSALYDVVEGLWDPYPPIRAQLQYNLGATSPEEARERYRSFTLADVWSKMRRPLRAYHGREDHMIPPREAERLCDEAGPEAELVLWPGAGHNLGNVSVESHPQMWDWLTDRSKGLERP